MTHVRIFPKVTSSHKNGWIKEWIVKEKLIELITFSKYLLCIKNGTGASYTSSPLILITTGQGSEAQEGEEHCSHTTESGGTGAVTQFSWQHGCDQPCGSSTCASINKRGHWDTWQSCWRRSSSFLFPDIFHDCLQVQYFSEAWNNLRVGQGVTCDIWSLLLAHYSTN